MIDSHIHLDFFGDAELDELLEEASGRGVSGYVVPAASSKDWVRLRTVAKARKEVRLAFGVHPWFAREVDVAPKLLEELDGLLALPMVVALGECGLDRARESEVSWDIQTRVFESQLELAARHTLPVILHAVRAIPEVSAAFGRAKLARGVLHGFVGNYETAKVALNAGLSLGIGPRALESEKTRDALRRVPLESLLVETDAPDTRFRGERRGAPVALMRVVSELIALRSEPQEEVRQKLESQSRCWMDRSSDVRR